MSQYKINLLPIELSICKVTLFINDKELPWSLFYGRKERKRFIENDLIQDARLLEALRNSNAEKITFSFSQIDSTDHTFQLDLNDNRYFIKPYIESTLITHLNRLGLNCYKDFSNAIQVHELDCKNEIQGWDKYKVYRISIEHFDGIYFIKLSFDKIIHRSNIPYKELNASIKSHVNKVVIPNEILKYEEGLEDSFPLINLAIFNQIGQVRKTTYSNKAQADYLAYFNNISLFNDKYLKGQNLNDNVKFLASDFNDANNFLKLGFDNNYLVFGNNNKDVNTYNGITRYGPYKVSPDIANYRFMFIFHESDKSLANDLYKYLKLGYKNFSGLNQFVKLPFVLDNDKTIRIKTHDKVVEEIQSALDSFTFDPHLKYIAIYLSPFPKYDDDVHHEVYYKVKEMLLKKGISSQVIDRNKISASGFNYSLPNIAIGLLAKAGGVPWKLKRDKSDFLLIGFGAKRIGKQTFVGNTVCFDNEGLFQEFNAFQFNFENVGKQIEAILTRYRDNYLAAGEKRLNKIIIHYFKPFGKEEQRDLEEALQKLDLDIPYIVLTINDSRDKDWICFDTNYQHLMPVSGTIIELRRYKEYLLFNNTRYQEYPTNAVDFYYPVKIKISKSKFIDTRNNDVITELIDIVYQFSRMHWRSIRQKSNPVTIYYSKLIAEMVIHFEENKLPENDTALKSLWFI